MKNLPIGTRLGLGFGLLTLLIVLIAGAVWTQYSQVRDARQSTSTPTSCSRNSRARYCPW